MSNIDPLKHHINKPTDNAEQSKITKLTSTQKKSFSGSKKIKSQKVGMGIILKSKIKDGFTARLSSLYKKKTIKATNQSVIDILTDVYATYNQIDLEKSKSTLNPQLLQYYQKAIKSKNSNDLKQEMTNFMFYLKDKYLHTEKYHEITTEQKIVLYNMFIDMSAKTCILQDSYLAKARTKKEKTEAYQAMLDAYIKRSLNLGTKDHAGIGSTFFRVTNIHYMTDKKNAEDLQNTCEKCLQLYAKHFNLQMYQDMIKNLGSLKNKLLLETNKDTPNQHKIDEFNRIINDTNEELDKYNSTMVKVKSGELFTHEHFMEQCYSKMIINVLTMAEKDGITLNLTKIPLQRM